MTTRKPTTPPEPSLYPNPDQYSSTPPPPHHNTPATNPPAPPSPSSSTSEDELLLELPSATITPPPTTGTLRIIQFTSAPHDASPAYLAFLSIDNLNVPLLSSQPVHKSETKPLQYTLHIPSQTFTLTLPPSVDTDLHDSLERIFKWFCQWQGQLPAGVTSPTSTPTTSAEIDRYSRLADKGVAFVESLGDRVNNSLQRHFTKRVETARDTPARDVKLGGSVTHKVLTSARSVVGAGASLAAKVSERVSDTVGKGLANNAVSRNLANAPEGTAKRKFHDNLMGGLVAFGRVYVAADRQGKIIIQTAGDGSAELAGKKYGDEAERAARQLGGIALDGYRIARFPNKLGATALLKGALKSNAQRKEGQGGPGAGARLMDGAPQGTSGGDERLYASAGTAPAHSSTAQGYRETLI